MCLGIPGKILHTWEQNGLKMGKVDFGGTQRDVCLAYVPEAQTGEYVVVHAGFAISVLSEEEARASLNALQELFDIQAELGEEPE
ncbi:MAG: HypC/HybG/HupF family hydrogenase formation chaperone [Anaerolineae bacterium]|nr:MAG: HypC/HybG/HupF family hydrogenase formation chaperone [Anaerolineae bacterium]